MDDVVVETLALLSQSEIETVEARATATADMLRSQGDRESVAWSLVMRSVALKAASALATKATANTD